MGWIYRGSAYCQLIRDVNRQKRLEFAMAYIHDNFMMPSLVIKLRYNLIHIAAAATKSVTTIKYHDHNICTSKILER